MRYITGYIIYDYISKASVQGFSKRQAIDEWYFTMSLSRPSTCFIWYYYVVVATGVRFNNQQSQPSNFINFKTVRYINVSDARLLCSRLCFINYQQWTKYTFSQISIAQALTVKWGACWSRRDQINWAPARPACTSSNAYSARTEYLQ